MTTTTKVKLWEARRNKSSKTPSWEVRWVVGTREVSRTRRTKTLAESLPSDLRQAMKRGEAFDVATGLPESMLRAADGTTWYAMSSAMWTGAGPAPPPTRGRACSKRWAA